MSFATPEGKDFDQNLIATPEGKVDVFVGAEPGIETQPYPLPLSGGRQAQCLLHLIDHLLENCQTLGTPTIELLGDNLLGVRCHHPCQLPGVLVLLFGHIPLL